MGGARGKALNAEGRADRSSALARRADARGEEASSSGEGSGVSMRGVGSVRGEDSEEALDARVMGVCGKDLSLALGVVASFR
mmetsp:Transcript_16475/g.38015  ORF Transcript_16475/g.38015 Transcript_16475/m.38015 type:complete len:82 (+) Transcript_16475:495-740(+)